MPTIRVFEALACGMPLLSRALARFGEPVSPGRGLSDRAGRDRDESAYAGDRRGSAIYANCSPRAGSPRSERGTPAPTARRSSSPSSPMSGAPRWRRADEHRVLRLEPALLLLERRAQRTIADFLHDLARRGHRITFYEPDAFDRQQHLDIDPPDWAQVRVYPADEQAMREVMAEARRADVVIKASGVGVFDGELLSGVLARRAPALFESSGTSTRRRRSLKCARVRSIPSGKRSAASTRFSPMAADRRSSTPIKTSARALLRARFTTRSIRTPIIPARPTPASNADLAFLGNRLPDREARVDQFFLEPAAERPTRSFLLGGSGWETKPTPSNVRAIGHVYTRDHNAFNSTPLAVLNIARDSMAEVGYSPATRVFEAAGAAACIITDAWRGVELFLQPGEEILVARDGRRRRRLPRRADAGARARIGEAARRRVLAEHTYERRGAQVDAILASQPRRRRKGGRCDEVPAPGGDRPEPLLVLGQRSRDDLSRAARRLGRTRSRHRLPRARSTLVRRASRSGPSGLLPICASIAIAPSSTPIAV